MDFKDIRKDLKSYLTKVGKQITVEQVILFGSYARGEAKKDSDVDLIILSKDFQKMEDDERLRLLYRLSVGFPYNLHVYGLTRDEFQSASPLTSLGEVKEQGVVIS